jgi:hypothetical protein
MEHGVSGLLEFPSQHAECSHARYQSDEEIHRLELW